MSKPWNKKVGFLVSLLAPMVSLFIAPAAFSLVKSVFKKRVTRAGKEVTRAERGSSNNMCHSIF